MIEDEYNQYWETVIQTMLDGLMVVDPDGMILSVNNALERLTGYRRDELIGQSCEILGCNTCFDAKAKGGEKHCQLFKEHQVRHKRCILRRKDGSPLHLLKNANVLRDKDNEVVGGVETMADCTELVSKEETINSLHHELSIEAGFEGIVGRSAPMQQVFDLIRSAADSGAPVIIYGESGTGKELVASAIHRFGPRAAGPFIKVNCAVLNESLLESELFGHVRGAFTGAEKSRKGRFEAASGGDIFLDEIGDLPLSIQVKLLRVLQEKEIEKVGDHQPIPIDTRIITATHKDLHKLMAQGQFRDDLYYRVGVIPVHLPPLRDRKEDIPLLIETFINRICLKTRKPISAMDKVALNILCEYHWPGNIRELINAIEYAFVLCPGDEITPGHLPPALTGTAGGTAGLMNRSPRGQRSKSGEKDAILKALEHAGGNQSRAARDLGISRVTLWKRLKKYGIQVEKDIQVPG
ncbi:MAG: sigma 54-interacting transcriptional regulator [Deltaproteobacteria bacterium]|nr:sigma 54-interacting transcriptional regulator [Deltaproteobacteria bacterium]